MIFELEAASGHIEKIAVKKLSNIGWHESDLQSMLFNNIEKVLDDNNLLLIMQSRAWQEEPDLMAIAANGDLLIFELKAWESQESNILQVLRYGQIYGQYTYEELNDIYKNHFHSDHDLLDSINTKFGSELDAKDINKHQVFITITNGLDHKTRSAVKYWNTQGITVKPWIYRLYSINEKTIFEINKFEMVEDPYSDIEEGYFILNTNIKDGDDDEEDMLEKHKAAAYFDPWKRNIEKIKKGNTVFLYRSGTGIVAYGIGSGKIDKSNYHNNPEYANEEYSTKLDHFKVLNNPIPARKIKQLTEIDYRFMSTMFSIDEDSGKKILKYIKDTDNNMQA